MTDRKMFWLGAVLFLMAVVLLPGERVQAAEKKENVLGSYVDGKEIKSASLDMDGDGKAEKVKVKYKFSDGYMTNFNVYVAGKKALTIKEPYSYNYWVDYIVMGSSNVYLRIRLSGDNDNVTEDSFFRYQAKKKKLVNEMPLLNRQQWGESAEITKLTDKQISLECRLQCTEVGWLKWNAAYVLKDGKLSLKKDSFSVKSTNGNSVNSSAKYTKLYKKNKFKAYRKLQFYKSTSLKKKAFAVKKGTIVKLTKLAYKNGKFYLKFTYGKKSGWMAITNENTELFYDVHNHLAG